MQKITTQEEEIELTPEELKLKEQYTTIILTIFIIVLLIDICMKSFLWNRGLFPLFF